MDRLDKFLLGASSALLLAGALAVPYAGVMIRHWND